MNEKKDDPNAWGKRTWENVVKIFRRDKQRDFENNQSRHPKTFIRKWVHDHLDGVRYRDKRE